MLKTLSRNLFFVLVSLSLVTPANLEAAAPTKKRTRPIAKSPPPKPKATPTQVLAAQLQLNSLFENEAVADACKRSNFKNLAIALDMNADLLTVGKGEFESSEDYQKRAGELTAIMAGKPIVICEPLDDNPDISFTYDADTGEFSGGFSTDHNIWRDVKSLGSYRSKTRMGIPMTVKASVELEYDVRLSLATNIKGCLNTTYSRATFTAPVSREIAPGIKGLGALVTIARLEFPYTSKEDREGSPSLDNPYDVYNYILRVHARPERFVLLDAGGKVAWSCVPGRMNPMVKPTLDSSARFMTSFLSYPSSLYLVRPRPSGVVGVRIRVGKNGDVVGCTVAQSSEIDAFNTAACEHVRKWAKFNPGSDAEGNPIETDYDMRIEFKPPY